MAERRGDPDRTGSARSPLCEQREWSVRVSSDRLDHSKVKVVGEIDVILYDQMVRRAGRDGLPRATGRAPRRRRAVGIRIKNDPEVQVREPSAQPLGLMQAARVGHDHG
ncbi:hypothetical protein [Microbacterium phyllosphaerae]